MRMATLTQVGQRDARGDGMLYRTMRFRAEEGEEENVVRLTASSDIPVQRWGDVEILVHDEGAVRLERLRTLGAMLVDHDPTKRAGPILSADVRDGKLHLTMRFGTSRAAQEYMKEVTDGTLRGVSVGYLVHTWEVDEDAGEFRAVDWEPYEASFTAIPVDASVGVGRSVVQSVDQAKDAWHRSITQGDTPQPKEGSAVKFRAWLKARGLDPDKLNNDQLRALRQDWRQDQGNDVEDDVGERSQGGAAAGDGQDGGQPAGQRSIAPPPAADDESPMQRQAGQDDQRSVADIVAAAESLGLRASDYIDAGDYHSATQRMFADVAKRGQQYGVVPPVEVTGDAEDKLHEQCVRHITEGQSLRAAHTFARQHGLRDLDQGDLADFILRALSDPNALDLVGMERSMRLYGRATEVSANFSYVTALAASKMITKGYDSYQPSTQVLWTEHWATHFLTAKGGNVDVGDLTAAAGEGQAFDPLTIEDGGWTGANEFKGATLDLSKEAVYNDQLGTFLTKLQNLGRVGLRSIDKAATAAIEGATWTNRTKVGAYSAANLKVLWSEFVAQTGPGGLPLGYVPRHLVLPPALTIGGMEDITSVQGEATARILGMGDHALKAVSMLFAASATNWWLYADPMDATSVLVQRHPDYRVPRLIAKDAGGAAAWSWRIEFPFNVHHSYDGTGKPSGARRGTAS